MNPPETPVCHDAEEPISVYICKHKTYVYNFHCNFPLINSLSEKHRKSFDDDGKLERTKCSCHPACNSAVKKFV